MITTRSRRRSTPPHTGLRSDAGVVGVIVAILIPALLILTAVALDSGRWYLAGSDLQKAADAAALAGVTKITTDSVEAFTEAGDEARRVAALNGYPDGGNVNVVPLADAEEPSQFGVSISSLVSNPFGAIFGRGETRITRTAFADYLGESLLASPCNTFGNEPVGNSAEGPAGRANPKTWASCNTDEPGFWAGILGPTTGKANGDRFSTTGCANASWGCDGTSNAEYFSNRGLDLGPEQQGNFFVLRIGQAVVDTRLPVTVQAFDPAYVGVGGSCNFPAPTNNGNYPVNKYAPAPDAAARYAPGRTSQFCTGDNAPSGDPSELVTSFVMRNRVASLNPTDAPVFPTCVKQFGSWTSAPGYPALNTGNSDNQLAELWRQWYTLCSFIPDRPGDYYLQVRTNADTTGGTQLGGGSGRIWTGSSDAYDPTPSRIIGGGDNMFGLRAFVGDETSTQPQAVNADMSFAAYKRVAMFQNKNSNSGNFFNLVQIDPNLKGSTFNFDVFDAGDNDTGRIQVFEPLEVSSPSLTLDSCTGKINQGSSLTKTSTACEFLVDNTQAGVQGGLLGFTVKIPDDYSCDADSPGGCWWRVKFTWDSNTPADFTTWSARVQGNTVRLVR
jgi:hypothetical protein